jgi:hypothetical protein
VRVLGPSGLRPEASWCGPVVRGSGLRYRHTGQYHFNGIRSESKAARHTFSTDGSAQRGAGEMAAAVPDKVLGDGGNGSGYEGIPLARS